MSLQQSLNIIVIGKNNNKIVLEEIFNVINNDILTYKNITFINSFLNLLCIVYDHSINGIYENLYCASIMNLDNTYENINILDGIDGAIIYYDNEIDKQNNLNIINKFIDKSKPIIYVNIIEDLKDKKILNNHLYLKIDELCDLPFIKLFSIIHNFDISKIESFNNYNKNIQKHIQYYNSSHILSTIIRNDPEYK